MINIFDNYHFNSQLLHRSLKLAGYQHLTICLEDDGFLPDDVTSPYQFFAQNPINPSDKPLFFNEVEVPTYWEITGTNDMGEIKNLGEVRGKIFYQPNFKTRIVSRVEWLDNKQRLRTVDFYNKNGFKFAEAIYDLAGKAIMKKYFDHLGKEIIYENYVTGDYVLNWKNKTHFFKSQEAFVIYYLKQLNVDLDVIIFNSLAMPFIALYRMNTIGKGILVWQENSHGTIPGNMKLMFDESLNRNYSIIIPNRDEYLKIRQGLCDKERDKVIRGGYLYSYRKQNQFTRNILTLTNSDQLSCIEELVKSNSEYQFHIAAITEMSNRLLDLMKYDNVRLYPVANEETIESLYQRCDIYLDNNKGNELLNAVGRAFENDMVIFATHDEAHNRMFTAPENIVMKKDINNLTTMLQKMSISKKTYLTRLQLQKNYSNEIEPEKLINKIKVMLQS
ncbi:MULTISPECIES: accessory Sec system glycosylation chaperone GtfB [Staphylococcus]|uniref:UDP-N-acetylglucosamine--peptide N-acetylglucosaminyltransferase stabilizing protein GtfB n=1 Tax=Staphylococcus pettenkoferi TaxID=170573 RepID=A0A2N6QB93_9STAP|nr:MULTISPECIES: accessory Sec system glycosylation chaperone GtfB [Staphylococcus]MCI2792468.1 accessory Sec system glycosylation chaperone GtfB [Staphylococcus pettenkoferi]OFK78895.1 accessory Sec system glycosylation chaperone GtfB [Staphylococcus sp. HMSC071G07]PMC16769.1 accessory Sec system glycosylation chaperone GtfB [Staphylococcus pettenkoferi]